jgi:hypothetical protein
MRFLTYTMLEEAISNAQRAFPNGVLVKNELGNLSVLEGNVSEIVGYVGFIDLADGRFYLTER